MYRIGVIVRNALLRVRINTAVEQAVIKSNDMYSELGEKTAERIKVWARRGRPLNSTGRFPKLKSTSLRTRKYLERYNKTDSAYRENGNPSNLTFTGQLLKSIDYKLIPGGVEIEPTGTRSRYKTRTDFVQSTRRRKLETPDNRTLAGFLAEKGFTIFTRGGVEKNFLPSLKSIVRRYLRRALQEINRRS